MKDVNCPYCDANLDIDHDDGYGYEEDRLHEQECSYCEKTFTFTTYISFSYETFTADCLNGSEHIFVPTITFPKECTKMSCKTCDAERKPTESEMALIMKDKI